MLFWVERQVDDGEQSSRTVFAVFPAAVPTYCVAEFSDGAGSV